MRAAPAGVRRRGRDPPAPTGSRAKAATRARGGSSRCSRCVVAAALIWFLVELFQPFAGAGHGSVTVTIPRRLQLRARSADLLARDGVIPSALLLRAARDAAGERGKLRAGHLSHAAGHELRRCAEGPDHAAAGRTDDRADDRRRPTRAPGRHAAALQGIRGNYLAATRHSRLLDPRAYGAPARTPYARGLPVPGHLPAASSRSGSARWSPTS